MHIGKKGMDEGWKKISWVRRSTLSWPRFHSVAGGSANGIVPSRVRRHLHLSPPAVS